MSAFLTIVIVPVIQILLWLINIYEWIIIIVIIMSWINPDPYNPIVHFLYSITEPVFRFARRILPLRVGMIDLSPLIIFLLLAILKRFLGYLLFQITI